METKTLQATAELRIAKPPREVFAALRDPQRMSHYFISSGSAPMEAGRTIHWEFADAGARVDVEVQKLEPDQLLCFIWGAAGKESSVTIELRPDGAGATIVSVRESGWPADAKGIERCLEQSKGWVHVLCCMKAYLEYGINLRKGGVVKGRI
jgi:uncharacterized protein YndB with AHSA1/START domain